MLFLRDKINTALDTINIRLDTESDSVTYARDAPVSIVAAIIKGYGEKIKDSTEDDIIVAGIFLFTICSYMADFIDETFEVSSSIAILSLFCQKNNIDTITRCIPIIVNMYNKEVKEGKTIVAIGQNIELWLNNPTQEQFERLINLYAIVRQGLKHA